MMDANKLAEEISALNGRWSAATEQERAAHVGRLLELSQREDAGEVLARSAAVVNGTRLPSSAKSPSVSIIVAARNYGRFLSDCLSSCVNQSVPAVEVIYSDDASTDDSIAVAKSISGVKVIACPRQGGAVAARNRGARASKGDVLIFVDGDDQLPPDYVAQKLFALKPEHSFAYGGIQNFGQRTGLQRAKDWPGYAGLLENNFCESASAIWRHVFEEVGGWQETPENTLWDWHLWLRAARIAAPVKSNSTLLYRVHGQSNSQTTGFARPGGDLPAILDRLRLQFKPGGRKWKPAEKKPLRVGFVFPGVHMGGATQWLASLLEHGSAGGEIAWSGIALSRQDKQDDTRIAALAKKTIIAAGPDLRHPAVLNLASPAAAVQFVAAESDVLVCWCREPLEDLLGDFAGPVVLLSHGSCPWTEELIRGQQDLATHFAAVSKAASAVFTGGVDVTVLHNGAEPERCKPKRPRAMVRKAWGLKPKEIAIAHIGRFSWDKNPLAVANAAAVLGAPYRAVFVGSGWREYDVKEAINNAVRNPVFAPESDQVGDALAAADCFVLATLHEGFSLSLIEAWLAGTPVVATRVGAIPEIEAKFGPLVVPVPVKPTPKDLAAAVKVAVSRRNKERVAKAQKVAREHFTAKTMGQRWAEFLLSIK